MLQNKQNDPIKDPIEGDLFLCLKRLYIITDNGIFEILKDQIVMFIKKEKFCDESQTSYVTFLSSLGVFRSHFIHFMCTVKKM